jgi:DUF4097 and DUF4098 domain-containing protein YvlB
MTMTTRLLRPALLFALVLVSAAGAAAQHKNKSKSRDDDSDRTRLDTTVSIARSARIDVTIVSGEIVVTTWDKPQVQVRATSDGGDIRFENSSSRLSLSIEGDDQDIDAHFELIVPKDARVSAGAVSGDVSVKGVGEIDANSVSGDVKVEQIAGRTELQSVSGEIEGTDLGGPVRVQSVNGDVILTRIAGDVSVQTVSSEMKLLGVKSSYVKMGTVSGDVEFEGPLDPKGRYEFHSHSGDVSLTVPRGTAAEVSFKGFSGELHSSCPMTLMPGDVGGGHTNKTMTFQIGTGGAKVSIETFSGDAEIKGCGKSTAKEE